MKERFFDKTMLVLALAALTLFMSPGCGGGGGGASVSAGGASDMANIVNFTPDDSAIAQGFMPDGSPMETELPAATRQSLRVVGDAGCTATRAFTRADIVAGGSVFVIFTLNGCTTSLESFYFGDNVPAGLTVTPVSLTINNVAAAYSFEASTPASAFSHWVVDDVPVDGAAELPAGQKLQIIYRLDEDGTHGAGYTFNFPLFVWTGHNPATSANVWGYSDAPVTLPIAPPPLGPSGGPDYNISFPSSEAFDGIYAISSMWAGVMSLGRWDLYYGFQSVQHMDYIHINYYNIFQTPTNTSIYYSPDGYTWTLAGAMPAGDDKPTLNINADVKYIWIKMTGNPPTPYPIIRDIDWTPVFESSAATGGLGNGGLGEGPSYNLNLYWPSNAFDGNMGTYWIGKVGNNAWDLYYQFTDNQILSNITIYWYGINYVPPSTVLKYSDDGVNWTTYPASFPVTTTSTLSVGRKAKYVKFEMTGAPGANFPDINDITFTTPIGASGARSNPFFLPAKAFDANTSTAWQGIANDGTWYLFYGYGAPHVFNNVKVHYYGTDYVPATTDIYYSNDGLNWVHSGTMGPTVADPVMPLIPGAVSSTYALNQTARYIAYEMQGTPTATYPSVLEITQ